jgi:hypothetical protein
MQHGRKAHMNRQQKRQFAGRSQQRHQMRCAQTYRTLTTREETMIGT